MKIPLEEYWRRYLARLPESGMGYQRVDVRLSNGRTVLDTLVYNGEALELPEDCGGITIQAITLHRGSKASDERS